MNAFDKSRKHLSAWCMGCDMVFDTLFDAYFHRDKKKHSITVTEFWITNR